VFDDVGGDQTIEIAEMQKTYRRRGQ